MKFEASRRPLKGVDSPFGFLLVTPVVMESLLASLFLIGTHNLDGLVFDVSAKMKAFISFKALIVILYSWKIENTFSIEE